MGETTSPSLLDRLTARPPSDPAWAEFVARYRPPIYAYRRAALQLADAADVTQAVLLRLVEALPRFRYDPGLSFRGWLRAVVRNAVADYLAGRDRQRAGAVTPPELLDGLAAEVEAEFDRELLELALRRTRAGVPARQWEAFRLTALEGLTGAEAGGRLGMPVATVYTARSKVQARLRAELGCHHGASGLP